MSAKRARHIAMKRLINRCGLIWGPSTETEAYHVADNIHTSAYLSGVRAGLEAARPVVAKAYRDGLSDGCEAASTIANATPLGMEDYGSGYARRAVFPSAESIAKEAEK